MMAEKCRIGLIQVIPRWFPMKNIRLVWMKWQALNLKANYPTEK